MAEAFVNVTEGSGKKLHGWDRTIGANTVIDEFTLPGEYPLASYHIQAANVSVATTSDHIIQVMAGSSLNVRIRRITLTQDSLVTSASNLAVQVLRLTTAGTGGTSVTPRPNDSADSAAGCTAMTLPSSKGTEGVAFFQRNIALVQTWPTGGVQHPAWEWVQPPNTKPIIIPAGTSNGIALKNVAGRAGATAIVIVELVETSFV